VNVRRHCAEEQQKSLHRTRDGEHTWKPEYHWVNRIPVAAIASMFGVEEVGWP
jgi:hypothetical protein